MAKKCKNASNCMWGNARKPGYCGYSDELRQDAICPKLLDKWDLAPTAVIEKIMMKANMRKDGAY